MDKHHCLHLGDIFEILHEVFKLSLRNKKPFLSIILLTMIPISILVTTCKFSPMTLLQILSTNIFPLLNMNPISPQYLKQVSEINQDILLPIFLQLLCFLLMTVVSLLSMVVTVYVTAMSYFQWDSTVEDLLLIIKLISVRVLTTWFYICILSTGLFLFILPLFFLLVLMTSSILLVPLGIVMTLVAMFLNLYIALLWMLSLVSSVLEDCYGLDALGKAEQLVKNRKVVGIVLTFIVMVVFNFVYLVWKVDDRRTVSVRYLTILVTLFLATLIKVLSIVVYTIFYIQLKQVESCEETGDNLNIPSSQQSEPLHPVCI